jgi:ribosome biogenesis GTPase
MDLNTLGWNDGFAKAFAPHAAAGLVPGRVAGQDKHSCLVITAGGPVQGTIPGKLLHQARAGGGLPTVGDWVAVSLLPGEDKGIIRAVVPRRTVLERKVVGRVHGRQVLAANVDLVFVTLALDASFNIRKIERFLVMAHEGGARPVVLLNKTDLCDDAGTCMEAARNSAGTTPVLGVSARTGRGMPQLRKLLMPGETSVFLGPSGVGKSSLVNRLYGDEVQATIEIRDWDGKGRHTTTSREMIQLSCGALVIDTPGLREAQLWHADGGIEDAFPDIVELGVLCRFRDCTHSVEQHCAVIEAATGGVLPMERLENYRKMRREQEALAKTRRRPSGRPQDIQPWRQNFCKDEMD